MNVHTRYSIAWAVSVAAAVGLMLVPEVGGVPQETLVAVLSVLAAGVVAGALIFQFLGDRAIIVTQSPMMYAAVGVVGALVLATVFSVSLQQAFFGTSMEVGTVMSFCALALFFLAGRRAFLHDGMIRAYFRVFVSVWLLAGVALLATFIFGTGQAFNVVTIGALGGFVLLIALARFELSVARVSPLVLGAVAAGAVVLGSDQSTYLALSLGALCIAAIKLAMTASGTGRVRVPYAASGVVLLAGLCVVMTPTPPIDGFSGLGSIRPSWQATQLIFSSAASDSPLHAVVGTGPASFSYAWNKYKPEIINVTPVWNTNFSAAVGGVPTLAVTGGLLLAGAVLVLIFGSVGMSVRTALRRVQEHPPVVYAGVSAMSVYGSVLYITHNVSMAVLVPAALALGMASMLTAERRRIYRVAPHLARGVAIVAALGVVCFIGAGGVKAYDTLTFERTAATFNTTNDTQQVLDTLTCSSLPIHTTACFRFLAESQRLHVQRQFEETLNTTQLDEATSLTSRMLVNARAAVESNAYDHRNWTVLGNIYTQLAVMGVADAPAQAMESYEQAAALSPAHPYIPLLQARLTYYVGADADAARIYAQESIRLKPDYTEAQEFLESIDLSSEAGEEASGDAL